MSSRSKLTGDLFKVSFTTEMGINKMSFMKATSFSSIIADMLESADRGGAMT